MALPVDIVRPGLAITVQHETVNDQVDYSPNLQTGGFATPKEKQRYQSNGLTLSYNPDNTSRYQLSATQQQMTSLRDAFEINNFSVGFKRRYNVPDKPRYSLDIGAKVGINQADKIYKNSYTSYADFLITEIQLIEPRDKRMVLQADLSIMLTDRLNMSVGLSGGISQTDQKEVVGSVRLDNKCSYGFNATSQGGSVTQLERCGNLISFEQNYPSDQTLKDNLGFSVADDVTYRDYFFGPQIAMRWQLGNLSLSSGYQIRQYRRPTLDRRIRQSGNKPVMSSQNAFANASMKLLTHWQVDARIKYQRAAFLDDVPFLYTAFTHQRYRDKTAMRFGLSITRYFN